MQQHSPSLIKLVIISCFNLILWTILGAILCWLLAILLVALMGNSGINWLRWLVDQDQDYLRLSTHFDYLSNMTHAIPYQWQLPDIVNFLPRDIANNFQHIFMVLTPYITATLLAAKLVLLRLTLCLNGLCLCGILGTVAIIDGLIQRSIRRALLKRESAMIYHHSKSLVSSSLVIGLLLLLLLPISAAYSELIVVLLAIVFSVSLYFTARQFKKYL